jgi:hypothetical protein
MTKSLIRFVSHSLVRILSPMTKKRLGCRRGGGFAGLCYVPQAEEEMPGTGKRRMIEPPGWAYTSNGMGDSGQGMQ